MRDAAKRKPGLGDRAVLDLKRHRRDEREGVGQAVAQLQVRVVRRKALGRQLDGNDDLVTPQIGVDLGRVAGQTMKLGKQDGARRPAPPR